VHDDFGLHKISNISGVVYSSRVETGTCPSCSPPRDDRETDGLVEVTHMLVHGDVALYDRSEPPWRDSLHQEVLHNLPVPNEALIFHKIDRVAIFHGLCVLVKPLLRETEVRLVREIEPCALALVIRVEQLGEVLNCHTQLGVLQVANRIERSHFDMGNFVDEAPRGQLADLVSVLDRHQEVLVHYVDDTKDAIAVKWCHSPIPGVVG